MPAVEQVAPTHPELEREVERRDALAETSQNHHESGARLAYSRERRLREDVEDSFARAAAVLDERRAVARVRCLVGGQVVAVRAAQTVGVECVTEELVAALFVQQALDREQHHGDQGYGRRGRRDKPPSASRAHEPGAQWGRDPDAAAHRSRAHGFASRAFCFRRILFAKVAA